MELLTRKLLADGFSLPGDVACGPLQTMPERIIQFGEGNFLRAFTDYMVDVLNENDLFNGQIVVVQPIKIGIAHLLNDQDGLYTLLSRGMQQGEVVCQKRVITAVRRALNPYEDWKETLKLMRNPDMRFVLSNTTEAGIVYVETPNPHGKTCPDTFPAKITSLLYERYNVFSGDPDKGLVFLPCELIDRNGDALRRKVLKHAHHWGLEPQFEEWVKKHNYFLNTLVDRIVPGFPREEIGTITKELGYQDKLVDTGELFHLWVIEGPKHLEAELPFAQAGLNVIWTDDMTPYRTRKVRVLNGAHTASVLAAHLAGLHTVGEMMDDDTFGTFVRKAVFDEILPTMDMEQGEKDSFAEAVLERFRNPYIRHELLSISLNSVSKWKVRVLPSLLDSIRATGQLPPALTFSLAALIRFYRGVGTAEPELRGAVGERCYSIRDDLDVLAVFEKRWNAFDHNHDIRVLVGTLLANESLWERDLTIVPGLVDQVCNHLQNMLLNGARPAVEALVKGPLHGGVEAIA